MSPSSSLPAFLLACSVALHSSDVGAAPHGFTPEPTLNSLSGEICKRFWNILDIAVPVASASSQPRTVRKQRGIIDFTIDDQKSFVHDYGVVIGFLASIVASTIYEVLRMNKQKKGGSK